ncbi:amidohydrolase family protein [Teredinibacter turnerae]|uniref:amidohydrolase family protein n=1 Tax=Teredinibacter turnerae TaxID=2426 RepID=UPI00037B30B5|nr:amidohydrolase family protein [Teredinibacter turnerae]
MIDTHAHLLTNAQLREIFPPGTSLPGDISQAELVRLGNVCGVQKFITVQSQESEEDTETLLCNAVVHSQVVGVIGWLNLTANNAVNQLNQWLTDYPDYLLGIRPMLQHMKDENWILQPGCSPTLREMSRQQICFEALVYPRHLKALTTLADRYPELTIVVNHAAKPNIAADEFNSWYRQITNLALRSNVVCKYSGLFTEANHSSKISLATQIQPYSRVLCDTFGEDRLLWGSDWPVLTAAAEYIHWHHAAKIQIKRYLGQNAVDKIFGGNAVKLYPIRAGIHNHHPLPSQSAYQRA